MQNLFILDINRRSITEDGGSADPATVTGGKQTQHIKLHKIIIKLQKAAAACKSGVAIACELANPHDISVFQSRFDRQIGLTRVKYTVPATRLMPGTSMIVIKTDESRVFSRNIIFPCLECNAPAPVVPD